VGAARLGHDQTGMSLPDPPATDPDA
jgi:hypothetical protein